MGLYYKLKAQDDQVAYEAGTWMIQASDQVFVWWLLAEWLATKLYAPALPVLIERARAARQGDRAGKGAGRAEARLDGSLGIAKDDVFRGLSARSGVPEFLLRDERSMLLADVVREGETTLIGLLDAEPRPTLAAHTARVAKLGDTEIHIDDDLVGAQPELLYGGLWRSITLRYDTSSIKSRILVERFTPYQLTRPDMEKFRTARGEFTLDEWLALLLTSAGYCPEAFPTFREKLLVLVRLVPPAQSNVNLLAIDVYAQLSCTGLAAGRRHLGRVWPPT